MAMTELAFSGLGMLPGATEALRFLDGREAEVIDLTCSLIEAPSPNPPGDETAVAQVVHEALARLHIPFARSLAKVPNRPNVIVRIDGAKPGRHVALCGHLDTKPIGEAAVDWRTDPYTPTIDGDRLYGLGSTDMKGAVAAMILAGAAFNAVKEYASGSLSLIFTADEEYGSALGAGYLTETGAVEADAIILGEPSGVLADWDAIRIVSRGIVGFRVIVHGTQMHSSLSDSLPTVNAVEAMARLMIGFRNEFRPRFAPHPLCPSGPTINIGVKALGGVGYGVVPGQAEFWTDVRVTPGMEESEFRIDVTSALERASQALNGATYEVEYHPNLNWLGATEVPPDDPMVQACEFAGEAILGRRPPLAAFPGGTDAMRFQAVGGIPTLAAFGPGQLPLAHGPNEWVSLKSVRDAMRMYALVALAYGTGPAAARSAVEKGGRRSM
jgi:acetylornithine deacetylase/succinyl-diaminopimelate desuccinylase-like protein